MYGPALYKDLVNGSEDAIKEIIRSGSGKMPGFKLGLQPSEIDAIVEYLKTVPKPPKNTEPGAAAAWARRLARLRRRRGCHGSMTKLGALL